MVGVSVSRPVTPRRTSVPLGRPRAVAAFLDSVLLPSALFIATLLASRLTIAIAILDGLGGRSGFSSPLYFAYPSGDTNIAEGSMIASGFMRGSNGRKDVFTQANSSDNAVACRLNFNLSTHDPCIYPTPAGVHICSPMNNQHLESDNVTFVASARALTQPLIRMTLTIDGTMVFQEFSERMDHSIQLSSGSHTAVVAEYDAARMQLRSQVTFTAP